MDDCEKLIAALIEEVARKAEEQGWSEDEVNAALLTVSFARRFPSNFNDSDVDWSGDKPSN